MKENGGRKRRGRDETEWEMCTVAVYLLEFSLCNGITVTRAQQNKFYFTDNVEQNRTNTTSDDLIPTLIPNENVYDYMREVYVTIKLQQNKTALNIVWIDFQLLLWGTLDKI